MPFVRTGQVEPGCQRRGEAIHETFPIQAFVIATLRTDNLLCSNGIEVVYPDLLGVRQIDKPVLAIFAFLRAEVLVVIKEAVETSPIQVYFRAVEDSDGPCHSTSVQRPWPCPLL